MCNFLNQAKNCCCCWWVVTNIRCGTGLTNINFCNRINSAFGYIEVCWFHLIHLHGNPFTFVQKYKWIQMYSYEQKGDAKKPHICLFPNTLRFQMRSKQKIWFVDLSPPPPFSGEDIELPIEGRCHCHCTCASIQLSLFNNIIRVSKKIFWKTDQASWQSL